VREGGGGGRGPPAELVALGGEYAGLWEAWSQE